MQSVMNENSNFCAGLRQKHETELENCAGRSAFRCRDTRLKPQLTRTITKVQALREPLRQATLDFGRHRGKTYDWVGARGGLGHGSDFHACERKTERRGRVG